MPNQKHSESIRNFLKCRVEEIPLLPPRFISKNASKIAITKKHCVRLRNRINVLEINKTSYRRFVIVIDSRFDDREI